MHHRVRVAALVIVACLASIVPAAAASSRVAAAAAGDPAPDFGGGGAVAIDWPVPGPSEAVGVYAVAVGSNYATDRSDVAGAGFVDGVSSRAYGGSDDGLVVGEAGGDFGVMHFNGSGLDPAFGDHGRLRIPFGGPAVARAAVSTASDGYGWIIAGTAHIKGSDRLALARITQAGRLDPRFGNGGTATFDLGPGDDEAFAIMREGGYLVGRSGGAAVVVGFTLTGGLQKDFGVGGVLRIDPTLDDDVANAIVTDYHTGRVMVAGRAGHRSFVAALGPGVDGLDHSYGTNGVSVFDLGGPVSEARAVGRVDAGLLVAGTSGTAGQRDGAVTRLTDSGAVDPGFGTAGVTVADFGGDDRVDAINVCCTPGQVTVFGGNGQDALTWSIDDNGATVKLDAPERSSYDRPMDVTEGPDGRVVVAAIASNVPGLAALEADGQPDATFGDDGTMRDPAASGYPAAVAVLPDGRIVVGSVDLYGYTADGRPDRSFGVGGRAASPVGGQVAGTPESMLIEPDGRIVVVGHSGASDSPGLWIGRFTADGRPDPTFGDGGSVVLSRVGSYSGVAVTRDADGSYVVVGRGPQWYSRGIVVARVGHDGRDDPGFGYWSADGTATSLAATPDGGYVVAGSTGIGQSGDGVQVIRLDHGGYPVRSYGDGGVVRFGGEGLAIQAVDLAVDDRGRAVVAFNGWADPSAQTAAGLVRLTAGGDVDPDFGDDGVVDLSDTDSLTPLVLDLTDHGRLYVAGSVAGDVFVGALSYDAGPARPSPTSAPGTGIGQGTGPGPARTGGGDAGYWMLDGGGAVYAFGTAAYHGRPGGDAVDLEPTPSGEGYWTTDGRGDVSAFGDAHDFGGVGAGTLAPGESVTSLSATPSGGGYWLFTDRGRVVARGDATHFGDMSGVKLNGPVLDSIPTPTGRGYYMVASDGGIFAFGDAVFRGSMGGRRLAAPVSSLVPDGDGQGYWLVGSDGGVFAFDAPFRGSMGGVKLNRPITGMVRYGDGYLMVAEDGGVFSFSDLPFAGSLGGHPPARPVVAIAARP